MHEKTAAAAVVVASAPLAMSADTTQAVVSVMLGVTGVALARTVFINRERRATGERQSWHETLPLTLTAMLITAAVVWDRRFGLSLSVFTGLGVGWTAILLLDVIGTWLLRTGRRLAGVTDQELGLPKDQSKLLNEIRTPTERREFGHEDPKT